MCSNMGYSCRLNYQVTYQGSLGTPHFDHLDTRNAIDNAVSVLIPAPVMSYDQKIMLQLISIILTKGMQWCHWQHIRHHVINGISGQNDVGLHFDHLGLRSAMVPLITPSLSCDTDASASGIKLPKGHVAPHFDHLDLKNAVALLMVLSTSHDSDAKAVV